MNFAVVGNADIGIELVRSLVGEPSTVSEATFYLVFGVRAAHALVPDFRSMDLDHGKAVLGKGGQLVVMPLYDDTAHYGQTAIDLVAAEVLIHTEGLVELMQPAPPETWPEAIAFLRYDGVRKTGKCVLCGKSGISAYTGDGLKWLICLPHALRLSYWAVDHLPAMLEHAEIARTDAAGAKLERSAMKMQARLLEGADRLYGKRDEMSVPAK